MKVQVLIVFIHVVLGTYAITVPPTWPKPTAAYKLPRYYKTTHSRPNRQNVYKNQQPAVPPAQKHNFKNPQFQTDSYWVPVTPYPLQKHTISNHQTNIIHPHYQSHQNRPQIRNQQFQQKSNYYKPKSSHALNYNRVNFIPHADKNTPFSPIRGSHIHSLPTFTAGADNYYTNTQERLPDTHEEQIKSNYNPPVSEHETPKEIPIKPIYPGEGQWAKPGLKHKPYVHTNTYSNLKNDDIKSDGYDVFENGEERYRLAQSKFKNKIVNHPSNYKTQELNSDYSVSPTQIANTEVEFVPQKLYAQVRRTETKKHLPRSEVDSDEDENAARLREIIKDSKIQTVYSEEGYEDSAYDHAGREKKAESEEGHLHRGEGVKKEEKQSYGSGEGNHSGESGRKRGQVKYKRTKDRNELSQIHNFNNKETYNDVKEKVEHAGGQELDSEPASSEYAIKTPLSKKVGPQRNFQMRKDSQKIEIKSSVKNGDDVNMEIHTEIKIMNGPDKKKHKFVKIVPSYTNIEEINTNNNSSDFGREKNLNLHRRVKRYNRDRLSRIYVRKRPNYYWKKRKNTGKFKPEIITKKVKAEYTTVANGKLSTSTIKSSTTTTKQLVPVAIKIKTRQKRFTLDDFNVDVPVDKFEINEQLSGSRQQDSILKKYPYIHSETLNEYSPLRYSEDMQNIPDKTNNEMSFYDSRDDIKCPVVDENIDPIPEKLKNIGQGDEDEDQSGKMAGKPTGPRLGGLGNKIDCLKVKYFGENPLDSPIFMEDVIELPVPPIFKNQAINSNSEILRRNYDTSLNKESESYENSEEKYHEPLSKEKNIHYETNTNLVSKISIKRDLKNLEPIIVPDDISTSVTLNPIIIQTEAVLKPPYTFKEMVNKIAKNKHIPKSIYDQIKLLENNDKAISKEGKVTPDFLIIYDNILPNSMKNDDAIEDKINSLTPTTKGYIDPKLSDIVTELSNLSNEVPDSEIINLVPDNFTEHDLIIPKVIDSYEYITTTTTTTTTPTTTSTTERSVPISSALTDVRKNIEVQIENQDLPKSLPIIVPIYDQETIKNYSASQNNRKFSSFIFDISKYLPQIKNHKIVSSEVQYKDEIKPSEQMNVYSDVLKAINISTQEIEEASTDQAEPITVKLHVPRNNHPKRRIRIKTTPKPPVHIRPMQTEDLVVENSNHVKKNAIPNIKKTTPQIFPTDLPVTPKTLPQTIKNMINQYSHPLIINVPDIEQSKESYQIDGLLPPSNNHQYRTIQPSQTTSPIQQKIVRQSRNINTFYVAGLRPPPKTQPSLTYNDYMSAKRTKRQTDSFSEDASLAEETKEKNRVRRKAIKYTEIVRSRPARPGKEDDKEEEEEEDLRPRKRIYDLKSNRRSTTTEKAEEEEYVILETEVPVVEKSKYVEPVVYVKPTGLPDYIKVIDKLHDYRFENNITTTLPEQETTTGNPRTTTAPITMRTQMVAESVNVRRGEPTYLQIIDQLHIIRKENEEKNPTTTNSIVTSEEPDNFPAKSVQNSNPYILPEAESLISRNKNTSNDEDQESHVRNLSAKLRTRIDTSKYKTIERTPVTLRHNLSSRYNSDDEILPLERMFTTKMPVVFTSTTNSVEKLPEQKKYDTEDEVELKSEPEIEMKIIVTKTLETTSENEESTTILPRRRVRPRTRPTTRNIPSTTVSPIRRRRPTRPLTTATSTESSTSAPRNIFPRRRMRQQLDSQRSQKTYVSEIPPNHKREYVPVTDMPKSDTTVPTETQKPLRMNDKKKRRLEKLHERRVTSEFTMTKYYSPEEIDDSVSEDANKKTEYEIIGALINPEMKHGGNYRYSNDTPKLNGDYNEQDQEEPINIETNSNYQPTERNNALNFNYLKSYSVDTQPISSDIVLTEDEQVSTWKPTNFKFNLHQNSDKIKSYPKNAEVNEDEELEFQEDRKVVEQTTYKPKIIKDPSKRMYFYAKL